MLTALEYLTSVPTEVLADTGAQVTGVVIVGIVLLVLAAGLILLARRKKDGEDETTETGDSENSPEEQTDAGTPEE